MSLLLLSGNKGFPFGYPGVECQNKKKKQKK